MRTLAALLLFAAVAAPQEVVGIGKHHEASRSVDLVFIGDGFTMDEKGEYEKIIDRMAANFTTPPFDTYAHHLNIHRVFLESKQSGIRTDANPVDPPLGARDPCA